MNIPYISLFVAVVTTILALNLIRPFALSIGLVDLPSKRKHHNGAIPLIGGLAMFLGILVSMLVTPLDLNLVNYLLLALVIVVFIGFLDDHHDISVGVRFLFQGVAALIMAAVAGVDIESIGNLFGDGEILLHAWSIPLTVFTVIGAMNALNMMDGIHGLAGGQSLIIFLSIACLALIGGNEIGLSISLLFSAVLLPFLIENLCIGRCKTKRVFMGDAGSMLLGLGIVWLLVDLSQGGQRSFSPVTALWLFSMPLIDTISIMLRRVIKGQSPFKPDRSHIHHIVMRMGYSDRHTLIFILIFTLIMAAIGIAGEIYGVAEWKMFFGFLAVFGIYFFLLTHAWKLTRFIKSLNN